MVSCIPSDPLKTCQPSFWNLTWFIKSLNSSILYSRETLEFRLQPLKLYKFGVNLTTLTWVHPARKHYLPAVSGISHELLHIKLLSHLQNVSCEHNENGYDGLQFCELIRQPPINNANFAFNLFFWQLFIFPPKRALLTVISDVISLIPTLGCFMQHKFKILKKQWADFLGMVLLVLFSYLAM